MKKTIKCEKVIDGIAINPVLPKNFDYTDNEKRPVSHQKFFGVAYVEAYNKEGRVSTYKDCARFIVHCLDGGAWDRPTMKFDSDSLSEAIECAKVINIGYGTYANA